MVFGSEPAIEGEEGSAFDLGDQMPRRVLFLPSYGFRLFKERYSSICRLRLGKYGTD